jgi:hypothetical protein
MTLYLISFDASAMDHIPDEDMPAVGKAAHAVVQEAVNAGVWVFGGGLENQRASIVATDGNVADGPYPCSARRIADGDVPTTSDRTLAQDLGGGIRPRLAPGRRRARWRALAATRAA